MANNTTLKFAIIGCGAISAKHVTALNMINRAQITAVCDSNSLAAESLGEKLGVPWFVDIQGLVKGAEIDIFSVLTPTGDHPDTVCALAPYGKPLIVEKPMAIQNDDADKMINVCRENNCALFIVKQNRFNPPILLLKEAIDAGRFGKIVMGSVRVWWARSQSYYDANSWRGTLKNDGGVLANQAAHHIDMLMWLLGDVESVSATLATRLADIEAEDTAAAIIKFKSGAIGVIEATTGTRPRDIEGSIAILGEKGSVEIGGFFMNELVLWEFDEKLAIDQDAFDMHGSVPKEPAWNLRQYLNHVIDCVETGSPALVDGLEGRKTTRLVNAIWESAKTEKQIRVL